MSWRDLWSLDLLGWSFTLSFMPRRDCRSLAALLLGGAAIVSCSKSPTSQQAAPPVKPRAVEVFRVEQRPMERLVTVTGSLLAREEATLSVKVPGRLRSINVDLGSVVTAGDLIAQVEPADYEIRLRQAEAAVAQARAVLGLPLEGTNDVVEAETLSGPREARAVFEEAGKNRERVRNLAAAGVVAASESDAIEATYKVATNRYQLALEDARTKVATLGQRRAELAFAQKQLADASMRAPFDGVVQRREADLGEYVAAGTPIVTLVRPDPLRLRLEIPEREAGEVRPGQPVRLRVEGYTNHWVARLDRLSPALNEANRMLVVESDVLSGGILRPGLFVRAEIVVANDDQVIAVPPGAVLAFAGLEKVVLVQNNRAAERTIMTGRREAGWLEVTSGLKVGDVVVLEPGGLRTGQAVIVQGEGTPRPERGESSGP